MSFELSDVLRLVNQIDDFLRISFWLVSMGFEEIHMLECPSLVFFFTS